MWQVCSTQVLKKENFKSPKSISATIHKCTFILPEYLKALFYVNTNCMLCDIFRMQVQNLNLSPSVLNY